ncbi:MAG: Tn3 family transposase, partial [Solirubrobacteraceae bacterium]
GYARMALACAYSEREMREAAGRHFTAENLDAASAVVVQKLRLLPHEWIAELLMTSSDGTRLETIGKSPIAAYAARHAGYRRRVLTWLLWLTGEYGHFGGKVIPVNEPESWHTLDAGHFGGKVIPVNEPESWHTLDALVHLDTPVVQHTTDTHGTTELTFAVADLLGWEFVAWRRRSQSMRVCSPGSATRTRRRYASRSPRHWSARA